MNIKTLAILLIIVLNLLSITGCAQTRTSTNHKTSSNVTTTNSSNKEQIGNVLFVAPKNWQKTEINGKLLFIAPDGNQNTVIAILPGEDFSGDLQSYFKQFLDNNQSNATVIAGGQINKGTSDEGYEVYYSQLVLKEGDGGVSYRLYVATHPGDRAEVAALISTDQNSFQQYKSVFEKFIESLDFANLKNSNSNSKSDNNNVSPSTKSSGSSNGNGFNGLFVGTISRQQFNPNTHLYDYIVRQQYYLFGSDGRVYFGLPKGGDIRDVDSACQQDPSNCGQYALSGNQLQLNRQGQQQSFTIEPKSNGFKLGNTSFYPVHSFDGLRLNGTYSFRSFANLSGGSGAISGGVSGERTISFTSDDRFLANNFLGFTGSGSVAGGTSSSSISGQGTYQIQGNTLILNSNGRQQSFNFFVYPENEQEARPGFIVIGGAGYLLRN